MSKKVMSKEVEDYFFKRYEEAKFSVVPGHWPVFDSKEQVDEWIDTIERSFEDYFED